MLVKLRDARIITRYSTASVINRFFILAANQELISSSFVVCYVLDTKLFLQPLLLRHRRQNRC
jgi:hypothetical protein